MDPTRRWSYSPRSEFEQAQSALEHKLVSRPERKSLIDLHILPGAAAAGVAPSIAAHAAAVQFQRIADGINTKLKRRPTRDDLINNGVIRVRDPNVASSLQGTQANLEFQRHAITVGQKLHHRPTRQELVQDHIIVHDKELDVDPKVSDAIVSLQRNRTAQTLEQEIASSRMPVHPLGFIYSQGPMTQQYQNLPQQQHQDGSGSGSGSDSEYEYYSGEDEDDEPVGISSQPPRNSGSFDPTGIMSSEEYSRQLDDDDDDSDDE